MKGTVKLVRLSPSADVKKGEHYLYEGNLVKIESDSTELGLGSRMCTFRSVNTGINHHMMVSALTVVEIYDEDTGENTTLKVDYYPIVADLKLEEKVVDVELHLDSDQNIIANLVLPSDKFYTEQSVIEHLRNISNFAAALGKRNTSYSEEDIESIIESYWNNNKNFIK